MILLQSAVLASTLVTLVSSHGRVMDPVSRASAWRKKFNTTANHDDNGINCGGVGRQWNRNQGKCGICGDAYDIPSPRPHELGGRFGQGVIVAKYQPDSIITTTVDLTAHHQGFWEFKLCPDPHTNDQRCFDKYPLKLIRGGVKYYPIGGGRHKVSYKLPEGLTCKHCVLQWRYNCGNNWGKCMNGSEGLGCGPQETFGACSDIAIVGNSALTNAVEDDYNDVDDIDNVIEDLEEDIDYAMMNDNMLEVIPEKDVVYHHPSLEVIQQDLADENARMPKFYQEKSYIKVDRLTYPNNNHIQTSLLKNESPETVASLGKSQKIIVSENASHIPRIQNQKNNIKSNIPKEINLKKRYQTSLSNVYDNKITPNLIQYPSQQENGNAHHYLQQNGNVYQYPEPQKDNNVHRYPSHSFDSYEYPQHYGNSYQYPRQNGNIHQRPQQNGKVNHQNTVIYRYPYHSDNLQHTVKFINSYEPDFSGESDYDFSNSVEDEEPPNYHNYYTRNNDYKYKNTKAKQYHRQNVKKYPHNSVIRPINQFRLPGKVNHRNGKVIPNRNFISNRYQHGNVNPYSNGNGRRYSVPSKRPINGFGKTRYFKQLFSIRSPSRSYL